ncbi:MAG: apolipoprotein N-acyltransferase [Myxococcota bacterium]
MTRILFGLMVGALSALAFPFAVPGFGDGPLFEWLPREVFLLAGVAYLYRGREPFAAGLGFFSVLLWWLSIAMIRYGGMPPWQALPALVLLVAYCAAYWALIPRLSALAVRVVHPYLAFAAAVLTVDWLRGWVIAAFPWGEWSWAMARDLPLVQLAAVGGSHAVTAVVALCGAAIGDMRGRPWSSAVVGLLVALIHLAGGIRMFYPGTDGQTLRVGLLQGNIAQDIKNRDLDNAVTIRATYEELSKRAQGEGAQLVVWPEAAWPGRPDPRIALFPFATGTVPMIVGAATLRFEDGGSVVTNSAFAVGPDGTVLGRHDKIALVPFGEYVPLARLLAVSAIVPELGEVSAGRRTDPIGTMQAGALVCYDGIFPAISRNLALHGSRLLVNITNDAWYGASSGPYQHRDAYVLRAVETDRWVARATNTGISTIIDPRGRVRGQTSLGEQTVLTGDVGLRDSLTVYVRAGDVVVWLALIAVGVGFIRLVDRATVRRVMSSA